MVSPETMAKSTRPTVRMIGVTATRSEVPEQPPPLRYSLGARSDHCFASSSSKEIARPPPYDPSRTTAPEFRQRRQPSTVKPSGRAGITRDTFLGQWRM